MMRLPQGLREQGMWAEVRLLGAGDKEGSNAVRLGD